MTYKDIYRIVIESGNFPGANKKVKAIAQLVYASGFRGCESKEDAVWIALEMLEEMTGIWEYDPSHAEFDDIIYSIVG